MTWAKDNNLEIKGVDWDSDVANYRANPSIGNYLSIRNLYPDREPPNAFFTGIDPLYAMLDDLTEWDIDPALIAAAMDADRLAIDALSLKLLALMHDREALEKGGMTHVQSRKEAIPNKLIDYLIVIMFESMEQYDEAYAVGALNFLVRQRLGGHKMAMHQASEAKARKQFVIRIMVSARRLNWNTSLRDVAKILKLQPSSISRLFKKGELEDSITALLSQPVMDITPFENEDPIMRAMDRKVREEYL